MDHAGLHDRLSTTHPTPPRAGLSARRRRRRTRRCSPRVLRSVSTAIQNFAPSPPVPAQSPRMSRLTVQRDADHRAERPIGDLPVADLDHDRVDEHRGVDLIQRARRPNRVISSITLSVIREIVSLTHRGAVDLREVRARSRRLSTPWHTARPRSHRPRSSRRCRFFTICGSNVPARSRSTSISHLPGVLSQHRLRSRAVADVARPSAARIVLLILQVLGHWVPVGCRCRCWCSAEARSVITERVG